jgi:hypothetical protein
MGKARARLLEVDADRPLQGSLASRGAKYGPFNRPVLQFPCRFAMMQECVQGNPWAVISTTVSGPVRVGCRHGDQ